MTLGLSEQEVSRRRARLAVATTQARALAREVNRLRAEILSGESQDDSPDPRQLELPEVSPGPTPALAQAEPTRQPTLIERLTLAEPVDEPTDGEALEQLAQELEEAGTVAKLRDAVRLPTVVVRAGLRVFERMGVLELDGDRYWRRTTVLAVEEAVLEAIRLGAHTWGAVSRAVSRAVSCPGSLVEWSLAELHEDGRVVVREHRIDIASDPPTPLTDDQVDDLVADEVGRSSTVPSSPQTVARWAHLSLSTVRSSLARLALVGRVVEVTSVSGLEYKLVREAAKASKPAKAKGKAKTTAEAKP